MTHMPPTAVYPGSFDPVTLGHLSVIRRAIPLFERLYVAVSENSRKTPLFSVDERIEMLRDELDGDPRVEVIRFHGLTVDLTNSLDASWIVRGIRSAQDAADELPMAHSNRVCGKSAVETLFLPTAPQVAFISSHLVREIAAHGGRLEPFVTERVASALRAKF